MSDTLADILTALESYQAADPDGAADMLREVLWQAALDSPQIIPILNIFSDEHNFEDILGAFALKGWQLTDPDRKEK